MYQALLNDTRFHEQLLRFDHDIAADAKSAGCPRCGGSLHWARFARKPWGVPSGPARAGASLWVSQKKADEKN